MLGIALEASSCVWASMPSDSVRTQAFDARKAMATTAKARKSRDEKAKLRSMGSCGARVGGCHPRDPG